MRSAASVPRARTAAVVIFLATTGQLVVATLASQLPQFAGKGFAARLVAYPMLMLALPAVWVLRRRLARRPRAPLPWAGFALVMAPFLVDVTGNTLNLYDTVAWWDDVNHLVNWFLLCAGIAVLLRANVRTPWVLGWLVTGIGALLAIGWEIGEWYTFIRHGTELETAYEDTLGDQALGTAGGGLAGALAGWLARRHVSRS